MESEIARMNKCPILADEAFVLVFAGRQEESAWTASPQS
jgi:hypothetical protein